MAGRIPGPPTVASTEIQTAIHLVFVTRSFGNGGAEKHLGDLIERLDPALFEVTVLTMGLDSFTTRFQSGKGPQVRVASGPTAGTFLATRRHFRALAPDIIVFVNGELGIFHWKVYLAARSSGAGRVVEIEHSTPLPAQTPASPTRSRRFLRSVALSISGRLRRATTSRLPGLICDITICVSEASRARLIRDYGYPPKRTITRRNGVDLRYFARDGAVWQRPQVLTREMRPVILCVAQLVPIKRIDVLIEAMRDIVARYPCCACLIVGSGGLEEQLRSRVVQLGLEENVCFSGRIEDVRPFLAAADVFVLPSEREGLPLSVLEAMAFGLPCVVAEAGGNRELVEDGINGFVLPVGSAEALTNALARLLSEEQLRTRMGRASRRIAEEKFDIEKAMAAVTSSILGLALPA
ncbi:MAG: glycosyltransferase [Acidobacteriota bacterium]|nr:glycosyltransferase [Acidobacteriota bacterium]